MFNEFLKGVAPLAPDMAGRFDSVSAVLGFAINIAIGSGIAGAVIFIVIAGILFMSSAGDPKAKEKAQKAFTYSIIGFVLTIAAFTIKLLILGALGATQSGDLLNATPNF